MSLISLFFFFNAFGQFEFEKLKVIPPYRPNGIHFQYKIKSTADSTNLKEQHKNVECATLGFAGSQPFSEIYIHDGKLYALATQDNQMQDSTIYKGDDFQKKISAGNPKPVLIGPFASEELAAQESCYSFFLTNIYLLRNFKVKKFPTQEVKLNFKIDPKTGQRWDSYTHLVDCDFSKQSPDFIKQSKEVGAAEILNLTSENYAYNFIKNTPELGTFFRPWDTFFDGPYPTPEIAALKACQIKFTKTQIELDRLHKEDQKYATLDLQKSCPQLKAIDLAKKFPFKISITEEVDKESYEPLAEAILYGDIAENYPKMTPIERRKKYAFGRILVLYERMIADGPDPEVERQKLIKMKHQLASAAKNGNIALVHFVINSKIWKIKFTSSTTQAPPQMMMVFAYDFDNAGQGIPHTKDYAIKKLCQFTEEYMRKPSH